MGDGASPGLASTMVYGSGEGNTVKHYYAGSKKDKKRKVVPTAIRG